MSCRRTNVQNLIPLSIAVCGWFVGCDANQPPQAAVPPKNSIVAGTESTPPAENTAEVTTAAKLPSTAEPAVAPNAGPAKSETPAVSTETKPIAKPVSTPALKKPEASPTPEQLAAWAWPEHEPVKLLAVKESNKIGLVTCTAQTKDGRYYLTAGFKIILWSVDGTEPEHVFLQADNDGKENFIRSMSVSPDGKLLAAGDSEGTVKLWNIESRTVLISKQVDTNDIVDLAFSPDSQLIATISFDNEVSVWTTNSLDAKAKFKVATNSVRQVGFVDDNRLIAFGEKLSVIKLADGKPERDLPSERYNRVLAYSKDRQSLILGGESGLRRWKVDAAQVEPFVDGNFADNEMVVLSPDDKSLATANGNSIRLWDIASGQCVQVIDAVGSEVAGLEWLPASNLLVAIPQFGAVRVWGTAKAGEAVGLKPLHQPMPAPIAADKNPAFPKQVVDAIDFRCFPTIPGSKASTSMNSNIGYEAPVNAEEAKLFYRYHFGKRGWLETTESAANPTGIEFRKDGFMVSASFYETNPKSTNISLNHASNFDLRWLPRFDAAPVEEFYSSEHNLMYRTKADLLTIETNLLRKMHQAGLTGYSRLHTSHNEEEASRDLDFLKHCLSLRVSIQKFPATPDQFTISYTRFLTDHSLPIPEDSGYVEFDGSTQPYLVANTAKSLEEARSFYDREMEKQGWLPLTVGRTIKEEYCWLPYFQEQKDVMIGLVKQKNGKTLVRVGEALENASWQLEKAKKNDDEAKPTNTAGLEAADFPILPGAKEVKFELNGKTINFEIEGASLTDLAAKYTEAMAKLGWEAEKGGVRSDEYTFFNFQKGKQEIAFRATARQGNAQVNIQGDGLLWSKDLPGGKRIISYELWMRDNKFPTGLELLERYEAEMKAIAASK